MIGNKHVMHSGGTLSEVLLMLESSLLPVDAFSAAVYSKEVSRLPPSVLGNTFGHQFSCSDLARSQRG
eukprot:11199401-Lingulodinium_polyedra.AAC.1